jgi:WD40 repeat protein
MLLLGQAHGGIEVWDFTSDSLAQDLTGTDRAPGGARYAGGANPDLMTRSLVVSALMTAIGTVIASIVAGTRWPIAVVLTVLIPFAATFLYNGAQAFAVVGNSNRAQRSDRAAFPFAVLDRWTRVFSVVTIVVACLTASRLYGWMGYLLLMIAPSLALLVVAIVLEMLMRRGVAVGGARGRHNVDRLTGHSSAVDWLRATSDDRTVVSFASRDAVLRLWTLGGDELPTRFHEGRITSMRYVGRAGLLATGGVDGRVIAWNVESGEPLLVNEVHQGAITKITVSPDETRIMTAGKDGAIIVQHLDERGKLPLVFDKHEAIVSDVSALSDGRVVSVDLSGTVLVWNVETGDVSAVLDFGGETVDRVAVSPDGRMVIGYTVEMDPIYEVIGVELNPDYESTIVADLATGQTIQRLPRALDVRFLADGRVLLRGKERLRVIDPISGEVLLAPDALRDGVLTPDQTCVISTAERAIRRWYLDDGRVESTSIDAVVGQQTVLSRDGRCLASSTMDGWVRAWSLETMSELASVRVDGSPRLECVQSGPSDTTFRVAVGDDAGRVYRLDYVPAAS